jgi:hypothetical protein
MKKSLDMLIAEIESTARNPLLPRDKIVKLCGEARRSAHVRFETDNPTRAAVMRAAEEFSVDDDGLVMLDGEYMTSMRLLMRLGMPRTPANVTRVGKALSGLGYVRLSRTRIHPASRWYAPREIV